MSLNNLSIAQMMIIICNMKMLTKEMKRRAQMVMGTSITYSLHFYLKEFEQIFCFVDTCMSKKIRCKSLTQ